MSLARVLLDATRRAAPAPVAVVALHLVLRRVLDLYERRPGLDLPMHALGGAAIAHSIAQVLEDLSEADELRVRDRRLADAIVLALAAAAAVAWEFLEWASDLTLGTDAQGANADTMSDLALGVLGAAAYLFVRRVRA